MASLARLSVDFVAKTAGFSAGIKRVQHGMKSLTGAMNIAKAGFAQLKAAAATASAAINAVFGPVMIALTAGAAAAAAGIAKVISSLQDIDDIADAAGRLGDTAANVVSLGHAFELTGGNVEGAQKALEKMQRTIGKAVRDGGAADKIFKDLGLSARDLADMLPTDALKTISDRLAQLGTNSEKSAAAMAIFGKGAADNLSSLTAGSEVISKLQKDAELLGITFSEQAGQDVGAAVDAISRLKKSMVGVFTSLAVAWAPAIEAAANLGTQLGVTYAGIVNEGMPAVREFGTELIRIFAVAETAIKHWRELFSIAILTIELKIEVFKNDMIAIFTASIPQAISIMGQRVGGQFDAIMTAIRTGLTTGKFEMPVNVIKGNILNDLEALTQRELTLKEQAMALQIGQFSGDFDAALKKRLSGLSSSFDSSGASMFGSDSELAQIGKSMFPDGLGAEIFDQPATETFLDKLMPHHTDMPSIGDSDGTFTAAAGAKIATPDSPAAALRGSTEAMSAIIKAQQSPMQQALNKIAEAAKKQSGLLRDILTELEDDSEDGLELVLP